MQGKKVSANPHSKDFPLHPSPEFGQAVKALERLAEVAGVDLCADAYAVATSDRWADKFASDHGVKPVGGKCCIQRLLGKKCREQYESCECHPPGASHISLWERDGKALYYVSELSTLNTRLLKQAIDFAERHSLEFEIVGGGSSLYPGRSFAVVYRNPREQRYS